MRMLDSGKGEFVEDSETGDAGLDVTTKSSRALDDLRFRDDSCFPFFGFLHSSKNCLSLLYSCIEPLATIFNLSSSIAALDSTLFSKKNIPLTSNPYEVSH